ncbi:MAG: hypothetical protein H6658_19440 [Ardenticatenaceae bacterium]|nr:hypothetical protein [Ardenticatenaceae bacterium]
MKNKKTIFILFSSTLLLLFVSVASAAVIIIDDFTFGSLSVSAVAPNSNSAFETAAGVLGGERDVSITAGGVPGRRLDLDVFSGPNGTMSFSQQTGGAGTAQIQWDGADASTALSYNLGPVDLTDSSSNDGFLIRVTNDDSPVDLTITGYTDASNFASATINLPGFILFGESVDFFAPFSSFSGGAGTMNPASISAVTLDIDGTVTAGADFEYSVFSTTGDREYGDLPTSIYATVATGSHIPQGLRLGSNLDTESTHTSDPGAAGDDSASLPDDEDGVVRSGGAWSPGAGGGEITVTVNGCTGTCRLNGWIDWSGSTTSDGNFSTAGDQILSDRAVTDGINVITFDIPIGQTFGQSFFARFRLCPTAGTCNTVSAADVLNGEVEDYLWGFGPTAVSLQSVSTNTPATGLYTAIALVAVLVVITAFVITQRRREQLD